MKKRMLLSSIMMIVLCFTLISGATFALFTSESKTNITIQSGKVEVVATINEDDVELSSLGEVQQDQFANGGEVKINGQEVELNLLTPGDKVSFKVAGQNNSNVSISYRVKIDVEEGFDLAYGLLISVNGTEYESLASYQSKWTKVEPKGALADLAISIELPKEAGNEYQDLSSKISVLIEAVQGNADVEGDEKVEYIDKWDGTADISWYNDTATEFVLTSSDQIAGLAELVDGGNTFEGKTIKLESDLILDAKDENGNPICFEPIGSYRNEQAFKGTFDGQGHAIVNMSQNTWELNNGYYYGDLGLGFFGLVEDATIKNLTMDGASISGESGLCGAVAATAYGDCTFENITITNSKVNDYQYYAGGVVGWASGNHQYINCNVDESVVIGGQWGDFGNASGGLIGGIGTSGTYHFKDCTVACRIDAVNDVVSAYQWYCYRNCGMLIGKVSNDTSNGSRDVVVPAGVTCENVTVIYNDWANYHYCEFAGTAYPYVRVEAGVSVDAYSNVRYGHPTDANGNIVVDDNHVHNDGEYHMLLIKFDQLFGGPGNDRYCNYGVREYEGVTVIYNNK